MISILMATYNGELFISEQIDSLLNQTYQDFHVYISDDNSIDKTWSIIEKYKEAYPKKFTIKKRIKNSGNAKYNFLDMMINIKSDYVMLCDQDDVWLPNKIEKSLAKTKELEKNFGKNTPVLVHTDLRVVDKNLNTINSSFKKAMNADYNKTGFNKQLIQNTLTGCTAIYNRTLADLISREPEYCIMHDWWIMLIASAFGKIGHIDSATVLYRQHGKNEIGAKDVRTLKYKMQKLVNYEEIKEAINNTYKQAESFLDLYKANLNDEQTRVLREYISIPSKNKFGRWYTICKLRVLKNGISRKIANFIFV